MASLCVCDFSDHWTSSIIAGLTHTCLSVLAAGWTLSRTFWTPTNAILRACHGKRTSWQTWVEPESFWNILTEAFPNGTSAAFSPQPDVLCLLAEMSVYLLYWHDIRRNACANKLSMFKSQILCGHPDCWVPQSLRAMLSTLHFWISRIHVGYVFVKLYSC